MGDEAVLRGVCSAATSPELPLRLMPVADAALRPMPGRGLRDFYRTSLQRDV